jgi:hypothetical protein
VLPHHVAGHAVEIPDRISLVALGQVRALAHHPGDGLVGQLLRLVAAAVIEHPREALLDVGVHLGGALGIGIEPGQEAGEALGAKAAIELLFGAAHPRHSPWSTKPAQ